MIRYDMMNNSNVCSRAASVACDALGVNQPLVSDDGPAMQPQVGIIRATRPGRLETCFAT